MLNTIAKIGGLGQPEPIAPGGGSHQFFKLEIHLQGRNDPIIIEAESANELTAGSEEEEVLEEEVLEESTLLIEEPFDQF